MISLNQSFMSSSFLFQEEQYNYAFLNAKKFFKDGSYSTMVAHSVPSSEDDSHSALHLLSLWNGAGCKPCYQHRSKLRNL